jgi:hypothetical protein
MPEPFTVQKWRAADGTLHDTEAEARDHEARALVGIRTDAVLLRLGVLTKVPYTWDEERETRQRRAAFNSGARAAIEAAIRAGLVGGEG